MRSWVLGIVVIASVASAQNILLRRTPTTGQGIDGPQRMTDGVVANDGEAWDMPGAPTFGPDAFVEWDLGAPTRIHGAALQGDNNDLYTVSVSEDGASWRPLWAAPPADGPGLRTRSTDSLDSTARFVRLSASGGDTRYSVSEFELLGEDTGASELTRARWVPRRPLEIESIWLLVGAAAVLLLASRRTSTVLMVALAAVSLWAVGTFMFRTTPATPDFRASLPWLRAAAALLAVLALLRERLWRARWPAHPAFTLGGLAVAAVLSVWCFLNLGTPQFHDVAGRKGTWLHHYDMRTYYPIARYFPELRFDGVYAASVLAVADGRNLDDFDRFAIRDLRTHVLTNVHDSKAHLLEVRQRFSPERWAMFLTDMQYFRGAMGDGGFLGSMNDHGGNATPVWFMSAWLLFKDAPASAATLWRGVIADIALFALAILALWWAWGARTALLAVVAFGAMDFYQFGSNWFGATLRHDWLSLWAIGIALLKKRQFALAGAALAWSAWIRAFPALTLITLSFPILFLCAKQLVQGQRSQLRETARPLLRVVLGVAVASVVLVGFSTALFGVDAWVEWLRKVAILDKDNHLNNISFRTYITPDRTAWKVMLGASLLMLFAVLRRAPLHRAAVWGIALLPIVFNPANYYLHSAFLFVTLAAEQGGAVRLRGLLVWLAVLAMCVASYFTNINPDMVQHFRAETIICFVMLGVLWLLEVGRPREA